MNIALATNEQMATAYLQARAFTEQIVKPLSPEDCMVQSMPDTSPTRWHLAHTTWFFENFVLSDWSDYEIFDSQFGFLFNSYYNSVGSQFPRPKRGLISRPGLSRIREYRSYVDQQMRMYLQRAEISDAIRRTIEIGIHHEQQHQELMLTDIKHVLSCNPTLPVFDPEASFSAPDPHSASHSQPRIDRWLDYPAELGEVGHDENLTGLFSYDNESPRHRVYLNAYSLAEQPVTCGQFIDFIDDGGYQRPDHWLSLGWSTRLENGWDAPLYWVQQEGHWMQFTLAGLQPVNFNWPVCHISYFEADAFARWAGCRLPTEFEWEHASREIGNDHLGDQFADRLFDSHFPIHPTGGSRRNDISGDLKNMPAQMFGGVWEWTSSSYAPYPAYTPPPGALGEYNGKFMCNQYVLRGGSVATSSNHIRRTYRNFFPPAARWQFSGCRLAK